MSVEQACNGQKQEPLGLASMVTTGSMDYRGSCEKGPSGGCGVFS